MASSQSHKTPQSISTPIVQAAPEAESGEIMFLRLPQVKTITGLSKSSLYALTRKQFPSAGPSRSPHRRLGPVRGEKLGRRASPRAENPHFCSGKQEGAAKCSCELVGLS